jgi:hypothetical protein
MPSNRKTWVDQETNGNIEVLIVPKVKRGLVQSKSWGRKEGIKKR